MPISLKFRQSLRAKAHKLKPIILLGNKGLTENVVTEVDRALSDHELIKIRVPTKDRDEKIQTVSAICEQTTAELVQLIGNIAVLFRKNVT